MNTAKLSKTEIERVEQAARDKEKLQRSQEPVNGCTVYMAFAGKRQLFAAQTKEAFEVLWEQASALHDKTGRAAEREARKARAGIVKS